MKLAKSLFLGSVAGLVSVAGASAADLGVKKPAAVEYVRTCPTYGAGFFVIPGTTSCIKLIGRVRADYVFNNDALVDGVATRGRAKDKNTFVARGYVGYDHRTATEYGLLRTYVRLYVGRDNAGAYYPTLEYGFIQFGGLTVGRVTPVFEHGYSFSLLGFGVGGTSDISYVNSIGYTFAFGGGFSATIALDNTNERKLVVNAENATRQGAAAAVTPFGYAGQAWPDVVAKLGYDASWGSVQLAGAVHQVRSINPTVSTKYGFAGSLSAKFNLTMLSAGSYAWLSGTISEGATNYAGYNNGIRGIGGQGLVFSDAMLIGTTLRLTRAWAIAGGIKAYVMPQLFVGVTGTYGVHDAAGAANQLRTATVAGTVGWEPAAGFLIAGEVAYRAVAGTNGTAANQLAVGRDRNEVVGRIRFQRDF